MVEHYLVNILKVSFAQPVIVLALDAEHSCVLRAVKEDVVLAIKFQVVARLKRVKLMNLVVVIYQLLTLIITQRHDKKPLMLH